MQNTLPQVYNTSKRTFVDLGLPSGTLWLKEPDNTFCTWQEAVDKFGKNLPTLEQFKELFENCFWYWNESNKEWIITGPNHQTIRIGAKGYKDLSGILHCYPFGGHYWCLTEEYTDTAWTFFFAGNRKGMVAMHKKHERYAILLVKILSKIQL